MKKSIFLSLLAAAAVLGCVLLAACNKGVDNVEHTDRISSEPTEEPSPTVDPRLFTDTLAKVAPSAELHVTMETTDGGYDIFAPLDGQWGYRYGPSIMYYPDGSIDAWFATPGTSGEWDWFTYKHSDDGGATWSKEVVVLRPTPDSMDHYSVCDPGVIYFGGYYYLGYTSTIVSTDGGINNNIFVARSKNPDGPYEKWNGTGWGGDPQPIVYFNEADNAWGAGEISFVVVDGTLYCYYTWSCPDGNFTKVSTAPATENWPAEMTYRGFGYTKTGSQDSCDVVYIEDIGKFVAFSTYDRFSANSGIALFESDDGIHFTKADVVRSGIAQFCHNMGISKRPDGHIQLKDNIFVGYGYYDGRANNWGKWPTRFQHVKIKYYEGEVTSSKGTGKLIKDYFWTAPDDLWPISIGTIPQLIELNITQGTYPVQLYWYDTNLKRHDILDPDKVTFDGFDANIVSFEGFNMKLLAVGETEVTAHYEGVSQTFKVHVKEAGAKIDMADPDIVSFRAVEETMTVYLKDGGKRHKPQIRGFVVFEDGSWGEAYNDKSSSHPDYPAMVDAGQKKYLMTFDVADETVCKVSKRGIITPKEVGQTTVTVTIGDTHSFTVTVIVEENRD